jgi:hypothetical protein
MVDIETVTRQVVRDAVPVIAQIVQDFSHPQFAPLSPVQPLKLRNQPAKRDP